MSTVIINLYISSKSVNRTLENINMLKDSLNIKKQTQSKKLPLVRFHSTALLSFYLFPCFIFSVFYAVISFDAFFIFFNYLPSHRYINESSDNYHSSFSENQGRTASYPTAPSQILSITHKYFLIIERLRSYLRIFLTHAIYV